MADNPIKNKKILTKSRILV